MFTDKQGSLRNRQEEKGSFQSVRDGEGTGKEEDVGYDGWREETGGREKDSHDGRETQGPPKDASPC